jgi:hypothetical protein
MATRKLTVEIVGDSRSLERAFKRSSAAGSGFQRSMKKIAYGAGAVVGGAFLAMGYALRRGFKEFMDGQKIAAQTNAVLQSTGGVANVTAKHVDSMAGALSRMTGIDDELIGSGENMLLTFTNIRNAVGKGPKVFDLATKAVLDTSVALGRDMTTTAIQVGKALNDTHVNAMGTITGWTALRRVGVMISPMMMKQAAAFIRAGKPMKAQLLLIRELQTEFGGSAAAFGSTLPGAFAKFHNAVDEVTGAFAQGLAPIVQRVATLLSNKMADPKFVARVRELGRVVGVKLFNAFKAVSTWFQANWPSIKSGIQTWWNIMKGIVNVAKALAPIIVKITAPLRLQLKILMALWDKILGAISFGAGLLSHLPGIGGKFGDMQVAVDTARGAMRHPLSHGGGGDVHVNGPIIVKADDPSQMYDKIVRHGKKHASRTRGRHQPPLLGHH